MKYQGLTIGVPREIMTGERRVAMTPETAAKFIQAGARVLVEAGAGRGAFYTDEAYAKRGRNSSRAPPGSTGRRTWS
jgi:H+-translocating NAD(P) transhydrogenase subunit alpha